MNILKGIALGLALSVFGFVFGAGAGTIGYHVWAWFVS